MSYDIGSPIAVTTSSTPAEIRLEDNSSQFVSVRAPTSLTTPVDFVLPDTSGVTGEIITKGIAGLEWGDRTDAENLGTGADVYAQTSGTNLQFRSITAGTDILVTENTNDIEISLNNTPSTIRYRVAYVAERNSTTGGKLALGNGSLSTGMGAVPVEDGELVAVGVSTTASAAGGIWDIEVNDVSVVSVVHSGRTTVENISPGIAVSAGDFINASQVANGAGGNHTVTFYIEHTVDINGLKGDTGDIGPPGADGIAQVRTGDGVPSNALGNDGDLYVDNLSGDYYTKAGGVWFLNGNLRGPSGGTPDYIKLTNTVVTNMNSSATGVIFAGFNTTPLLNTNPGTFTVTSDTITVNDTGIYEAYFNFKFDTLTQRTNVAVEFVINGVATGRVSNSDYIRSTSGHNSASTALLEPFSLTAGDTIQIQGSQNAFPGVVSMPVGESMVWVKKLV